MYLHHPEGAVCIGGASCAAFMSKFESQLNFQFTEFVFFKTGLYINKLNALVIGNTPLPLFASLLVGLPTVTEVRPGVFFPQHAVQSHCTQVYSAGKVSVASLVILCNVHIHIPIALRPMLS